MIQFRASNEAIFTGRRHSAMRGWRAIRREMGLQGVMSARQLKKKWDNLKERYRSLKNPPEGLENQFQPNSWRWFQLMDQAMTGRLAGTASIVQPSLQDEYEEKAAAMGVPLSGLDVSEMAPLEDDVDALEDAMQLSGAEVSQQAEREAANKAPQVVLPSGAKAQVRISEPQSQPGINTQPTVFYATLLPDYITETSRTQPASRDQVREAGEADRKLAELQGERQALEREQAEFDRELIALEKDRDLLRRDMDSLDRDRTSLDRERAAIERDRAALDRDQATLERDRVILDRDRAFLDRDRAFLERDRVFVERAREDLERERALWRRERDGDAVNGHPAEVTEKEVVLQTRFYQSLTAADPDPDQLETRQRLVSLFQRLVEKL
ncbi:rootletin-like isoform X2 [Notolabrus celidotus]|nr:rootletin-like isoform X2 [Notolabrus celidotus]